MACKKCPSGARVLKKVEGFVTVVGSRNSKCRGAEAVVRHSSKASE